MNINTPYLTLAEADTYLGTIEPWNSTSTSDKNAALEYGRAYLDSRYTCVEINEDDAPDPIKIVNAELANLYLTDKDKFFNPVQQTSIKRKKVKADDVEVDTQYDANIEYARDPFPQITAILSAYCSYQASTIQKLVTR